MDLTQYILNIQKFNKIKLHLGCGTFYFSDYINIDYPSTEHNIMQVKADIYTDIKELSCSTELVDEIRLHHVFEHFNRVTALAMLIRWHSWLRVGGVLRIETPDIEGSARQLLSNSSFKIKMGVLRHLAGDQAASWAYHVDHWYPERFRITLEKLGFRILGINTNQWDHEPYLSNVEVYAVKEKVVNIKEQLIAAEELLLLSTVAPEEKITHSIWREQLLEIVKPDLVKSETQLEATPKWKFHKDIETVIEQLHIISDFFQTGSYLKSNFSEVNKILVAVQELIKAIVLHGRTIDKIQVQIWVSALEEIKSTGIVYKIPMLLSDEIIPTLKKWSESVSRTTGVVIFSKDRAMQLDATISSLKLHCFDINTSQITVIYKFSNSTSEYQYRKLANHFPEIKFILETNFHSHVLTTLHELDYVLWLVDDSLFVHSFSINDCTAALNMHPDALGVSLRLGTNTEYCYSMNVTQKIPLMNQISLNMSLFDWTNAEFDFGYALEVSSSLYRIEDLYPLLYNNSFTNPNSLEELLYSNLQTFNLRKKSLLCYNSSVAFCIPVNVVQNSHNNRAGSDSNYSVISLSKMFDEGLRINVTHYIHHVPNSCHQEMELEFVDINSSI